MTDYLREFFAVTITSVYHVACTIDGDGIPRGEPTVEKIALHGESSVLPGERLRGGRFLGVRRDGLRMYNDHYAGERGDPEPSEHINTLYHGGGTTPIVALFLKHNEAMICLAEIMLNGACELDSRWERQTLAVLLSIDERHPVFIVSSGSLFGFNY